MPKQEVSPFGDTSPLPAGRQGLARDLSLDWIKNVPTKRGSKISLI